MDAPPVIQDAPCPVCESTERTRLYGLHDAVWNRPGEFGLVRCNACGLAYLSPRPSPDGIRFYYQDLYSGEGLDFEERVNHGPIGAWINRSRIRALRRALGRPSAQHLDVGCGLGGFCRQALSRGIVQRATGVDFDPVAIETARERTSDLEGIELLAGALAEQSLPDASFESASMIHFLEHSFVPVQELEKTYQLLKPGGVLLVEVPSMRSLARRIFHRYWLPHLAPQHISLFSPATLRTTLERVGFDRVRIQDSFAPLVWFSSFVLWYQHSIGTKSRWAKNPLARAFTIGFTLLALIPLLLADAGVSVAVRLLRSGDHIRATAFKPAEG